jgi:hypothetical protein
MTQDVQDKIAQTRQRMQGNIDALWDEISWGRDSSDIHRKKRRFAKAEEALAFFDQVIENLPEGFEFRAIRKLPDRAISDERAYFSPQMKRDFYRAVASVPENKNRLSHMGVKMQHIAQLATTGELPRHEDGKQIYDFSIEHIHDIALGGESVFDNLCIYPLYLNNMKSAFISTQFTDAAKRKIPDEIITFFPVDQDGSIPKVPMVPGGYRNPVGGDHHRERVAEFLQYTSAVSPAFTPTPSLTREAVPV